MKIHYLKVEMVKLKMQIELTAFEAFKAVEFPCKEIEVIFAKFAQMMS